jgi:transposase
MAFLVADSAFYRAANLQKLAQTPMKWITRVPAILNAGKTVLAQTDPQALASLKAGYHYQELTSPYRGIEPRWVLISSESRQAQVHRTVDKPWRKQSDKEIKAFKILCRTVFACEADARLALLTFEVVLRQSRSRRRAGPRRQAR